MICNWSFNYTSEYATCLSEPSVSFEVLIFSNKEKALIFVDALHERVYMSM